MLGTIGHFIMTPLYYLISVVLVGWHNVLGAIFGRESGVGWVLSIIGLTLVIRALLIPVFVKQIKSSRNMQLLQPKMKELQSKYKHDRERLAQETMALYKETGTNPLASCLPLLVQMPIFLALLRLLEHATKEGQGNGVLTSHQARLFADATIFGGKISSTFTHDGGTPQVKIVAGILVVAMIATTFLTQRQLMSKNMPPGAMTGQYAQQQKMLLYVLPVAFGFGGVFFPIAVLFYWTTSNLWTMGQQFYIIRRNPAPGTPAFEAKRKRDAEKARNQRVATSDAAGAGSTGTTGSTAAGSSMTSPAGGGGPSTRPADRRPATRPQPKRQSRRQRSKQRKR